MLLKIYEADVHEGYSAG